MERKEDRSARAQLECIDRTLPLELNTEIVLPDYRSEISRLLWVRPTLLPAEQFVGGGKADFSGPVRYELLYVGPDNALYCVTQEQGYAFSLPLDGIGAGVEDASLIFSAEPILESLASRVVAPRRVTLRTRMHMRVRGYAMCDLAVQTKGEGAQDTPARLGMIAECGCLIGNGQESITLSDQMEIEEGVRLIGTHGAVFLPEVNATQDAVLCRGEAILTLLLTREEEGSTPYTVMRRIPFEGRVPLTEVDLECGACATGSIADITATQEGGELQTQLRLVLSAGAQRNEETVLCRDIFLPGARTECRRTERTLWQAALCTNRNFSVSGELPLSELSLSPDAQILDVLAEAELREKTQDGAKCILAGDIRCHLLCHCAGEYSVKDAAFPFRIVCEQGAQDLAAEICVPICHVSMTPHAARMDAELQLALRGCERTTVPVLCEAIFSPAPVQDAFEGTELYYPAAGETLWDVAKRYSIAPEALAEANSIVLDDPAATDSLGGAKYLLLP